MRLLTILVLFIFSACETNTDTTCFEDNDSLHGHWEWIKTYGSIAGQTWTPGSTGDEMELLIDEMYMTFTKNGQVTDKTNYQTFETDTLLRDGISRRFIRYNSLTRWFMISNDSLIMHDLCFDCFDDYYVRK